MIELNIKPYCNCHLTGKWQRPDGYTKDPDSGIWIHSRCRKPSRMNYNRLINGNNQVPQPSTTDIYEIEYKYNFKKWAKPIIDKELNWDYNDED